MNANEKAIMDADTAKELADLFEAEFGVERDHINFLLEQGGIEKLRELYFEAIRFDLTYGTNTCLFIPEHVYKGIASSDPDALARPESAEHGVKHRTSLNSSVEDGLKQASRILRNKGIDTKNASFFDFGTGTGKPVFIAKHPDFGFNFKKATGIDYFTRVLDVARENCKKMDLDGEETNIRFVFADATDFKDFNGINVAYFYNPFDQDIMAPVEKNLRKYGGKTLVVYNKPLHGEIFEKNGWKLEYSQNSDDPDRRINIYSIGFDNGHGTPQKKKAPAVSVSAAPDDHIP